MSDASVTTAVCTVCGRSDPFESATLPCPVCGGTRVAEPETVPADGYPPRTETIRERRTRNATLDVASAENACDEWRGIYRERY